MANIIISDTAGKTEEFKRPDHYDFMTSAELKKKEFSGIRTNSLTDMVEIWVLGELKGAFNKDTTGQQEFDKAYREIFALNTD